jgi:hypothetical protein
MTYPADAAAAAQIEPSLRPGEQLLWCGRPDPSVVFVAADIVLVPFSLVWLGFALLWEAGTKSIGAPVAFRSAGVPFVLIGVYLVAGQSAPAAGRLTRWNRACQPDLLWPVLLPRQCRG